jgi:hypothetical protein
MDNIQIPQTKIQITTEELEGVVGGGGTIDQIGDGNEPRMPEGH